MRSRDTSAEARRVQQERIRRMSPSRRVELAFALSEQAREISIAGIRSRDPSLTYEAARRILLRQLLGAELFDQAYPSSEGE